MVTAKTLAMLTLIVAAITLIGTMRYGWNLFQLFQVTAPTTVWCNDYNFICCGEDILNPTIVRVDRLQAKQCPTYASRCEISSQTTTNYAFYSSCQEKCAAIGCWAGTYWDCSGTMGSLEPGVWLYVAETQAGAYVEFKLYQTKLFDCGRASCAYSGIPLTTSGCVWVTDKRIYNPTTGQLVEEAVEGVSQDYTVPKGACYLYTTGNLRRACGDVREICSQDSECVAGHTYQYQGKGAECQSGQLMLYGCKQYDTVCLDKDILPDGSERCVGDYAISSRCEVVQSLPIGCCPQSDYCGPNAFCDPADFTCKSSGQVECTYDYDCGIATSCDFASKSLKKPVCSANKCVAQKIQDVDCCFDVNCPSGYYCAEDYKCYQQTQQKTTCPFECCVRESMYFDRACPEDKQCVDHQCVGQSPVTGPDEGTWVLIFTAIAGVLSFLMVGAKALREKDWVGISIAGVVALIVSIAVWWFMMNWKVILLSLGILGLFGGLALYFFGAAILFVVMIFMAIIRAIRGS